MSAQGFLFDADGFERARRFEQRSRALPFGNRSRSRAVPLPPGSRDNRGRPHDCCSLCSPFFCTSAGTSFTDCAAYPNGPNGWAVNLGAMFFDCCPALAEAADNDIPWLKYKENCEFWGPDITCLDPYNPTRWVLTIREGLLSTLVLDLGDAGRVVYRSMRPWCRQCGNEMRLCGPVPACVRRYLGAVCVYPQNFIPRVCCGVDAEDFMPNEFEFEIAGIAGDPCCVALNGHWVLTWAFNSALMGGTCGGTLLPFWSTPAIPACEVDGHAGGWSMFGDICDSGGCDLNCLFLAGGQPSYVPGVLSDITVEYVARCDFGADFCKEPINFHLNWPVSGGPAVTRGCGSQPSDYPGGFILYPVAS
jgi:hypothetical protein